MFMVIAIMIMATTDNVIDGNSNNDNTTKVDNNNCKSGKYDNYLTMVIKIVMMMNKLPVIIITMIIIIATKQSFYLPSHSTRLHVRSHLILWGK